MKKVITVLSLLLFVMSAQRVSAQVQYDKGDVLLNLGIGAGYYYASGTPIVASAEFSINDAISIGPYFGFTSYGRRYFGGRWNYTFIDFGARGSYHFSKHIDMNTDKLDLYAGAMLGFVVSSYSTDNNLVTYNDPYGSTLRGGILGGARWFFTDKFSANAEVAIGGISPFMIGVSFKL